MSIRGKTKVGGGVGAQDAIIRVLTNWVGQF